MASKMTVRKGDNVLILSGKDKGKEGKVLRVIPSADKVVVEGLNIRKRHERPTRQAPQGGVVETPAPLDRAKVMVICGSCNKPARIGTKIADSGERVRVCRKCGAEL